MMRPLIQDNGSFVEIKARLIRDALGILRLIDWFERHCSAYFNGGCRLSSMRCDEACDLV